MSPNVKPATTDEQLAARFLESPAPHREAFAGRCADLLHIRIRKMVLGKGMCPASASRETFAEDVFSLALFRLAQSLDQLKSAEKLQAWLRTIAKSAIVDEIFDRVRRSKSGPIQFDSLDDLVARAAEEPKVARILSEVEDAAAKYHSHHWRDPEDIARSTERFQILKAVYDQHSTDSNKGAECGVIVALHYEEEMSFLQIASLLDRPKSTVHEIVQDNMIAYREMYNQFLANRSTRGAGSML